MSERMNGRTSPRHLVSRRSSLRLGSLGVVASAAWLAACGNDDKAKDSGGQASGGSAAAGNKNTAQTLGAPKRGGVATWRLSGTPPLDPHANTTFRAQDQAGFVYSRMLKFKTGLDPAVASNYDIEPDLAQKVELPNEGTQITFTLQPNAFFHDKPPVNGRAVTSEDVKFSLERFRNEPKNSNRFAFGSPEKPIVESVSTPDARTVVIKTASPYGPIQNLFANPQYLWIMPKEVAGGFDPTKDQIGSGPWVLKSVQPDISVEMSRNPKWFINDRPYLDGIKTALIPEVAQEIAQFQAERLDIGAIPAEQREGIERSNPKASFITYIPTTYTFLSPQQREGSPFRDERLRRALSLAVDRKSWMDLLYLGKDPHILNFLPASMGKWWLDPTGKDAGDAGKWFKFDPKQAKQLVEAAGFSGSTNFIFANNAYGETFNQGAEATSGMLNQNGFKTSVVPQDYLREYISAKGTFFGSYDGVFYGLQTPFTDPHDYLFNMMSRNSARNHAGINDPQLESMLQAEEQTLNEAERVKKVHDIQRYAMAKMYYVPMGVGAAYIATQPWLKNYQYSATYGFGTEGYADMWIDRG